jgi:hypothetical protein
VKFSTFAEVLTPDHPDAGSPGLLLKDVLAESGGRYEYHMVFAEGVKAHYRKWAAAASASEIANIAETGSITISLEHLRGLDPETTRIVVGTRIDREPSDGDHLPGVDR